MLDGEKGDSPRIARSIRYGWAEVGPWGSKRKEFLQTWTERSS